jgi:hypothetical protein
LRDSTPNCSVITIFSRSSKRSHLVKALEAIMDQKVVDNLSKIFMIFEKKIVEDFKKVKLQQKLD